MKNSTAASALIHQIKDKGISDAQLAAYLEVSTKTISNWITGVFAPRGEKLRQLSILADNPDLIKNEKGELVEYNIGIAIKKIEAMQEVTLSVVAELLAKANSQPSTVVLSQLQELVNQRLKS